MNESMSMMATIGLLGYGFGEEAFRYGLDMDLDFIAADAGSMDPGPHYLGAGVPFVSRKAIKRDIGLMLEGALAKGIPMLIGSAGGGGSAPQVAIVREVVDTTDLPVLAYHVSGEYAMLKAAADNGWLDYEVCLMEVLTGFKRAGCRGIFTYGARDAARIINAT